MDPAPRQRKGLRVVAYDARPGTRELARLARTAESAGLRVPIAAEPPLARARQAHERLAKGHVLGRIVLRARRGR